MAQLQVLQSITQLPQNVVLFIRQARQELKKVSWPSRQLTLRYTGIVVVSSAIIGVISGGLDYLLTLLLENVI